jgi:hypothetical protein
MESVIQEIEVIENDINQLDEKCRKIDCVIVREEFDAIVQLICDLFKCCFKKCLKSS